MPSAARPVRSMQSFRSVIQGCRTNESHVTCTTVPLRESRSARTDTFSHQFLAACSPKKSTPNNININSAAVLVAPWGAECAWVAREVMAEMAASGVYSRPLVTEVLPEDNYWPAEAYHQDFFERNPNQGYCMAVAAPKLAKFRKTFVRLQKP